MEPKEAAEMIGTISLIAYDADEAMTATDDPDTLACLRSITNRCDRLADRLNPVAWPPPSADSPEIWFNPTYWPSPVTNAAAA